MAATAETCRYIVKAADVCGGKACIQNTRIGVHEVIGLLQTGKTGESATRQFPGVTRAQAYACLACYEHHLAEIDYLVAHQMADAGK